MSTRNVPKNQYHDPIPGVLTAASRLAALLVLLLIAPGPRELAAFQSTRVLGGRQGWDEIAEFSNTRLVPGWQGGADVALIDGAHRLEETTDLLAGFDGAHSESAFSDRSGNYHITNHGVRVVTQPRRFGSGAAAFDGTSRLVYRPGSNALFASYTQAGSFAIDFWLHPLHVTEGATVFRWRGALMDGSIPVLQDMRMEIEDRRLHWVLSGVVVRAEEGRTEPVDTVRLSARRGVIPRTWQHHELRYDAGTGRLSYLVDGIPEAVRHLSESGREDGTVHSILFGTNTGDGITLGQGFEGALDEFRITRSSDVSAHPTQFTGDPGRVVSRPLDLGGSGARLSALESLTHTPGATEIRGYYRISDVVVSNQTGNALDADWRRIPDSGRIDGNVRGRFLQLRFDLLADAARAESPRLRSVHVRYEAASSPPPPSVVRGASIPGGVRIEWSPVVSGEIAGYRVYSGTHPRRYTGAGNHVSPRDAGSATELELTGLDPDVPYVFAVESYDRYGQSSGLSREVEVRAGGDEAR